MNINITDINSAAVASLRYESTFAKYDDLDKVGTLIVTFKSGSSYAYHAVSVATFRDVLKCDSLGSAIAKLVKPGHSFTKLSDVAPTDVVVVGSEV